MVIVWYRMGTKDKLIARFLKQPKDFTFDEMVRLFGILGFTLGEKGATSGSRIEFYNAERGLSYGLHRPHPGSIIKSYVMKQVLEYLTNNKLLEE